MALSEDIFIVDDVGKRCLVGSIFKKCFYKRVKHDQHFYQNNQSWGIDAEVFNKIVFLECDRIKILDKQTNIMYETSVITFNANKAYVHHKPHRAQLLLNTFYFTITKNYKNK